MPCTCAACWTSITLTPGIPLDEVESADSIVKRFKTAAMSYGASPRKPTSAWPLP